MKIKSEVTIYEVDDSDKGCGVGGPVLTVASHWNHNGSLGFVVIGTPDGKKYTVSARDLDKATAAATNLPR